MKQSPDDIDWENLKIQPVEMQHHREQLRRSLLASPHWQNHPGEQFSFWKGNHFMHKKTYITAGIAVSILAVAIALGLAFLPLGTRPVQAAALAKKSSQAIANLSPEQQGALAGKLKITGPADILEQAKKAKDLKVLTYEQFMAQQLLPTGAPGPDPHSLTFLQFTDTDGATVTLGINPDSNLPDMIISSMRVEVQDDGSIKTEKGGFSLNTGEIQPGSGGSEQGITVSSGEVQQGGAGAQFQWVGDNLKVEGAIHEDGTATFTVNGKSYTAPAGTKFSIDQPVQVKAEGGDIYVNGVKLIPGD
jgi:hypothetical protein